MLHDIVVSVVSVRSNTTLFAFCVEFHKDQCSVPSCLCCIHGRSGAPDWTAWSIQPPVCRWHPGDRILSTTSRQRSAVSYVNLFGWCCLHGCMRSNRLQLNTSKTEFLLHIVSQLYRAPRFELDLTWSIERQQFVSWVSSSMPIYPDAHVYWKQRRRVLLLCDSCGQYVGACRWPPTNHWSFHWCSVGRTTATRCCLTSSVVWSPSSMRRQDRSSISGGRTT